MKLTALESDQYVPRLAWCILGSGNATSMTHWRPYHGGLTRPILTPVQERLLEIPRPVKSRCSTGACILDTGV